MSEHLNPEQWRALSQAELDQVVQPDLDDVLQAAPPGHGYCLDIVAKPQYARVAMPCFNNFLGLSGFKVGFPMPLWREYILPRVPALIAGPVVLFGCQMQATGWFARVEPATPIRSADQLVWVSFEFLAALNTTRGHNNLTCAPGVQALHGALNG